MRFDELFAPEPGNVCTTEWVWCVHCERVHRREDWEKRDLYCPTPGCDGNAMDAMSWERIREFSPEYPEVPEEGAYYAT